MYDNFHIQWNIVAKRGSVEREWVMMMMMMYTIELMCIALSWNVQR
jgi:hypothetical protein